MLIKGLEYFPDWLADSRASELYQRLHSEVPWQQGRVKVFGKWHDTPRLQSWHGDAGIFYRYSGKTLETLPWTPALSYLKQKLSESGISCNSVLCNLYRDGKDKMGWHRDNEPELGHHPVIASVSLGAKRDFKLRNVITKETLNLSLLPGSLLILKDEAQRYWEHSLPARLKVTEPRINLTFRTVYNKV